MIINANHEGKPFPKLQNRLGNMIVNIKIIYNLPFGTVLTISYHAR